MTPEQLTSARRDMKYGNLIENRHVGERRFWFAYRKFRALT
jgi:hypothetical protein